MSRAEPQVIRRISRHLFTAVSEGRLPDSALNPFRQATGERADILRLLRSDIQSGALDVRLSDIQGALPHIIGLGPLEELMNEPQIISVNVQDYHTVKAFGGGVWQRTTVRWADAEALHTFAAALAARTHQRFDSEVPLVEATFQDPFGRIQIDFTARNAAGVTIHLRRGRSDTIPLDWMRGRTLSDEMADFLLDMCHRDEGMIIVGRPGTGKTTLLEALLTWLPRRPFVLVDDQSEIRVLHPDCMVYNVNPESSYDLSDSLRSALRKNTDRVVVAEVRGKEAAQMLSMSNSATFWCTLHGTAESFLIRLGSLVRGVPPYTDMTMDEIRNIITISFPIVVETAAYPTADGRVAFFVRKIIQLAQEDPSRGDSAIRTTTLFETTADEHGRLAFQYLNEPSTLATPRYWGITSTIPRIPRDDRMLSVLRTRLQINPYDSEAIQYLKEAIRNSRSEGAAKLANSITTFMAASRRLYEEQQWEALSRHYGSADILTWAAVRDSLPISVEDASLRASQDWQVRIAHEALSGNGSTKNLQEVKQ
jgi:pilus assembly protein CpaF